MLGGKGRWFGFQKSFIIFRIDKKKALTRVGAWSQKAPKNLT
jgi:hypothetical protein